MSTEEIKMSEQHSESQEEKIMDTDPALGAVKEESPSPSPSPSETVELKINGEVRTVTRAELIENAQKYLAGEDKFRAAAEMRKQASEAIEFQEAYSRLKSGDTEDEEQFAEDISAISEYLGLDYDTIVNTIKGTVLDSSEGATMSATQIPQESEKMTLDKLPPEVREAVDSVKGMNLERIREEIETDIKNNVDKDEELGKLVSKLESSGNLEGSELEEFKQELYDMALGEVQNQLFMSNQAYGPEMRLRVLQKVRTRATRLGIGKLGKSLSVPPVGSGYLDPSMMAGLDSDQPPKRVDAADGEYPENFAKRLAYALKSSKGK